MTSGGVDIATGTVVLVLLAAFVAGWIDAVVGGGGLVQLPALLLVPGISPVQALATNKVAGIMGTSVSAWTFYRRLKPDLRTALPMALVAMLCAAGGAQLAVNLPEEVIEPIILAALVGVGAYTIARPSVGRTTALRWSGGRHLLAAVLVGAVIGAYDGLLGPGTGSFLVIALVGLLGYAFLEASAKAKIVNAATNLGAIVVFAWHGAPMWGLGLAAGVANVAGAYLGARMAISRGSAFVRAVFLVVVGGLVITLARNILT